MNTRWKVAVLYGAGAATLGVGLALMALVAIGQPIQLGVTNYDSLTLSEDLIVGDDSTLTGDVAISGALDVDGATTLDAVDFAEAVTFDDTVTISDSNASDLLTVRQDGAGDILVTSDGATERFVVEDYGLVTHLAGRDAASGYDYGYNLEMPITGVAGGAKTYGMQIEMTREAGYESQGGDIDDAGLKIRVDTEAVTTTAGNTMRAIDAEAKADNPDGTITNLQGAQITAKSDTSAGSVDSMIAVFGNVQNNAKVTSTLIAGDFRTMRQAATAPTSEYVMRVRNANTSGTGVDAGIYFKSDYSGNPDDFDYLIDGASADVNTADIRLSNGETISNATDTAIQFGGFVAFTEGTVIDLGAGGIITPTASYQPITNSTAGSIDTSDATAIADGAVAGQILVLINEDAQDIVIKDGANTQLGGDITLTGGADDALFLIWDGTDWTALSVHDN